MPKGKKFNAAEKHFLEKELKYKQYIKRLEDKHTEDLKRIVELEKKNNITQTKNIEFQEWVGRLLKYTELNIEDIKKAVESDKTLGDMSKMFNHMMNSSSMF